MTLLTGEVREWIGREVTYEAPEEVGRAAIRYFALAIGDASPLSTDDSYAREHGYASVIAPPTFVCETNQFMSGSRDGHVWNLPITGCRLIRGGNEYEFFRPLYPEDRVNVSWTIQDIRERSSSGGVPMLVVISKATYRTREGELIATNVETLIYQAAT